jgi:hypothetical protein
VAEVVVAQAEVEEAAETDDISPVSPEYQYQFYDYALCARMA